MIWIWSSDGGKKRKRNILSEIFWCNHDLHWSEMKFWYCVCFECKDFFFFYFRSFRLFFCFREILWNIYINTIRYLKRVMLNVIHLAVIFKKNRFKLLFIHLYIFMTKQFSMYFLLSFYYAFYAFFIKLFIIVVIFKFFSNAFSKIKWNL